MSLSSSTNKLPLKIGNVLRSTAFRKAAMQDLGAVDRLVRDHLRDAGVEVTVINVVSPYDNQARYTVTWQAHTGGDFEQSFFLL
jgi:hypothetical protein